MCIVRAIKEQEEIRVMTSSFSDKGRAAALDRPAEISQSEISEESLSTFIYPRKIFQKGRALTKQEKALNPENEIRESYKELFFL